MSLNSLTKTAGITSSSASPAPPSEPTGAGGGGGSGGAGPSSIQDQSRRLLGPDYDDPAGKGKGPVAGGQGGEARDVWRRLVDQELQDLKSLELLRALLAEFLGCVFLVFFGVGAGLSDPSQEPRAGIVEGSLSSGFVVAAILSALANASGAHINPAVSMGFLVARQCSCVRFLTYTLAQSAGAIAGAALLKAVTPASKIGNLGLLLPAPDVTSEQALMAEFMISFFLLFAIIAMLDKGRTDVQGSVPFMVGLIVSANIFYAHNISGASMNPIRNLGPAVVLGKMDKQWIYWLGPLLGGACGSLVYDRIFSVAMTPAIQRVRCFSGADGGEFPMEIKPLKPSSNTRNGSFEQLSAPV